MRPRARSEDLCCRPPAQNSALIPTAIGAKDRIPAGVAASGLWKHGAGQLPFRCRPCFHFQSMRPIDHPHFRSDPEAASWSRRWSFSRWLMRLSLLSQWGLAALAWGVLGVIVGAVDIGSESGRSSAEHLIFFGVWVLPGALMLTAAAARNSWVRLTDPARFKRDRTRARQSE